MSQAMRMALALILALAASHPALAQAVSRRAVLTDLSHTLGESHALRQVCRGEDDQYWRDRMMRLLEAERPDPGDEQRFKTAFNTGYLAAQAQHRRCSPQSRAAETRSAQRGAEIAQRLAGREP